MFHHMIQRLPSISLRVQVEHDGLFIRLDGRYLPHGHHDIRIQPRLRGVSRVVNDSALGVARVDSKGNRAIVGPSSLGIGRREALVAEHPRAFRGVRLPFQSILALGDDRIERQSPGVGNGQAPCGLLLKIGDGDFGPSRMAVSRGDDGAGSHGGVVLGIDAMLKRLGDLRDGISVLKLEVIRLVLGDEPPREGRYQGRRREEGRQRDGADAAHLAILEALLGVDGSIIASCCGATAARRSRCRFRAMAAVARRVGSRGRGT